jgi:hypothetical protein
LVELPSAPWQAAHTAAFCLLAAASASAAVGNSAAAKRNVESLRMMIQVFRSSRVAGENQKQ